MNRNLIIEKANQLIKRDIKDFNKLDIGYKELIQDKYISKVCSEMSFSLVDFYNYNGKKLSKTLNYD